MSGATCLQCGTVFTRQAVGAMKFCSRRCSNQHSNAKRQNTVAKFWSQVAVGAPDECWPWIGFTDPAGYGAVGWRGKRQLAHRLALSLTDGDWKTTLLVRHTCDNKPCCNPAHLRRGTHLDNTRDAIERGLFRAPPRGELHAKAKLTDRQAMTIRLSTEPSKEVAARYGVCVGTVQQIRNRSSWRHLP